MNLSEKDFSHSKPFYLDFNPSGVGGYMKGPESPRKPVEGISGATARRSPPNPANPGDSATPHVALGGARRPLQGR